MKSRRPVNSDVRRYVIQMFRLLIGIVLLIVVSGYSSFSNNVQQRRLPDGWKRVSGCNVDFVVPPTMENLNARGIDSCVAKFSDANLSLSIDYGRYGNIFKKHDENLDHAFKGFRQQITRIGRRWTQIVTYLDDEGDRNNPEFKYVANLYVLLHVDKGRGYETKTSLMMTVRGRSEKEQSIAKQIFRTVRFH